MTLARYDITGLTDDIPDEIIDHPVLGEHWTRTDNPKPLVDYQVNPIQPEPEQSFGDPATTQENQ